MFFRLEKKGLSLLGCCESNRIKRRVLILLVAKRTEKEKK